MSQLRRIKIFILSLPNPPSESNVILKNLLSAQRIKNFSLSEDLVKRLPKIKKLEMICTYQREGSDKSAVALNNIGRLESLESFTCLFSRRIPKSVSDALPNLTFPLSLKKLKFAHLHWDDVTTKIGSLPLLEVLRLSYCSGSEWKLEEGQFVRLNYLEISDCDDLRCFTAEVNHFPCLQELELNEMESLKEISSDIGDISGLRSIRLNYCPDSAVICAKEIADVQCENGNEELLVEVYLDDQNSLSSESLRSSSNFHVVPYDE